MDRQPDIRLTLRPLPDTDSNGHPVPVHVRIRKMLKYADYQRLDCTSVEWLDPSTGEPWQDNEEPKEQQS